MTDSTRFTKTHEWIRQEAGKIYAVGITNFAQQEIRDIVFIELPKIGKEASQGAPVATIESVKAAFEIYAPASGKITAANENAVKDVTLVHKDPQGQGWLFKLEISNPQELDSLLSEDQYKQHTATASH